MYMALHIGLGWSNRIATSGEAWWCSAAIRETQKPAGDSAAGRALFSSLFNEAAIRGKSPRGASVVSRRLTAIGRVVKGSPVGGALHDYNWRHSPDWT